MEVAETGPVTGTGEIHESRKTERKNDGEKPISGERYRCASKGLPCNDLAVDVLRTESSLFIRIQGTLARQDGLVIEHLDYQNGPQTIYSTWWRCSAFGTMIFEEGQVSIHFYMNLDEIEKKYGHDKKLLDQWNHYQVVALMAGVELKKERDLSLDEGRALIALRRKQGAAISAFTCDAKDDWQFDK